MEEINNVDEGNDTCKVTLTEAVQRASYLEDEIHTTNTYNDAIALNEHAMNWQNACQGELDSIKPLKIFKLVDTPIGRTHISTRWILVKVDEKVQIVK